jgi:hypothetical protein
MEAERKRIQEEEWKKKGGNWSSGRSISRSRQGKNGFGGFSNTSG